MGKLTGPVTERCLTAGDDGDDDCNDDGDHDDGDGDHDDDDHDVNDEAGMMAMTPLHQNRCKCAPTQQC